MTPTVTALDHLVLSVADIAATTAFYTKALGMELTHFTPKNAAPRLALSFGRQKINLHDASQPFAPHAAHVHAGTADLCFLSETSLEDWQAYLARHDIPVEKGPVERTGAQGPIRSLYLRDPDGNLIEIANQIS